MATDKLKILHMRYYLTCLGLDLPENGNNINIGKYFTISSVKKKNTDNRIVEI